MNTKKIADAVRVIREAYAPLVRTNTVCDGLTAIIDELDPPEPAMLLDGAEVGDICTRRDGKKSTVTKVDNSRMPVRTSDNLWYYRHGGIDTLPNANDIVLIEKPKPAPFAVGDWVEYKGRQGYIYDDPEGSGLRIQFIDGDSPQSITHCPHDPKLRKLDPSEVIVKIGCLEGTVTYAISDDCFLLAKVYDPQHRACCIDMSMLDTATRELVESLLKAQEEK